MHKYKATLNTSSIDNLIKDLEKYRDSLDSKTQRFAERLLEIGVKTAESVPGISGTLGSHKMENYVTYYKELDVSKNDCYGVMFGTGRTFEVSWGENQEKHGSINSMLALEFGTAGLAVPPTKKFGAVGGKGTNSKYGHDNDYVWYFAVGKDNEGKLIWKKATAIHPTRPMLQASEMMQMQVEAVAKEVFGK